MIHYITLTENSGQVLKFLAAAGRRRVSCLRPRSYESLFAARRLPAGHYIFTDHDYLTSYECERAAEIACAIEAGAGGARILNHPARVLERTALLQRLHADGINDFTATRIDTGEVPPAFPVFIRTEDAKNGPETDILHTRADFDAALADYAARGIPLKGRVAIGFCPRPDGNGHHRKFGAYRLGDHIIPVHVQRSAHWCVKRRVAIDDEAARAQNRAFMTAFEHARLLMPIFDLAGVQAGRIDYDVCDGRVRVFEIGTNEIPRFSDTLTASLPADVPGRWQR